MANGVRIPDDQLGNYPTGPLGDAQCKYLRNSCHDCKLRYKPSEVVCSKCGRVRPRCGAKIDPAQLDCCRQHVPRAVLSAYNLAVGRISEHTVEEALELHDARSVDVEVAIAKVILGNIIGDDVLPDPKKLACIREYMQILAEQKKLETGADLELKFDDRMAEAIRRRFKSLIATFQGAINEFVRDPAVRQQIMERVKVGVKIGGRFTTPGPNTQPVPETKVVAGIRLDTP
ncbi:hypothetical protein KW797_02480 [Candidatus Parcubacteria bacterium]|nr:hypothetical protein [Candidatus Parcubacteria bacterium]